MRGARENSNAATEINQFHADLARRIVGLLEKQDCPAGCQLKEQWLAGELGVSRSPVRAALRLLDRYGIVRTVPNQGCFLARPAAELAGADYGLPETGEERLYGTLTRDRFTNRLPQQINVTALVRQYGASRSLVERVLSRLADEGLVERETGRGWRFLPTVDNPGVHEESYRFRLAIEPSAILMPLFRPDMKRLADLKQRHLALLEELGNGLPPRRIVEVDADFHESVGLWSNNRFVAQAIQQQTRLRRLMEFRVTMDDPERMAQSCREHLEILDALEKGDRQKASSLLHRHIEISRDVPTEFGKEE